MNNSDSSLERIENPSTQLTVADVHALAGKAESMLGMVSNTINNTVATVAEIAQIQANVKLQCRQLEHALDCLMLKAQRDINIYKTSLPILDKQFDYCQQRLDKLMDKAMDLIGDDFSDAAITRQESMMSLIEIANGSLNNLIAKLIPSY